MNCSKCGQEKQEKAFATFRTRKGELRRRGVCWKCRGQYAEENFERLQGWRHDFNKKNKTKRYDRVKRLKFEAKAYVDDIKANNPCVDCGEKFHPVAMDFDHPRGGKTMGVAQLVGSGYKLNLIKAEIAKCELVCACCHRVRTWKRGENLAPKKANTKCILL